MATLFYSYAHEDERLRDQLEKHLTMLRRQGLIEGWHDRRITPGDVLDNTITAHLQAADVILLLVSADFLASEYCWAVEVRRAMELHVQGKATVIPVVLRPCDWHDAPFGGLLGLPRDGKAVTSWANLDEAFLDVVGGIKTALAKRRPPDTNTTGIPREAKPTISRPAPRAGTARIAKTFTELDRDDFIEEVFAEVAAFFENSLAVLGRENPGIDTRFRRLDTRRFVALVYRGGQAAARCTIWSAPYRGFPNGIGYVANDSGDTNSLNESLSVEAAADSLYFKPMGMAFIGRPRPNDKMTPAQAAEYLWEIFLAPLQSSR